MTKLVIRLLDGAGQMLGAVVHHAAIKGDGCLRASGPVVITAERDGLPAFVSTHWCDVHVETRVPFVFVPVKAGRVVSIAAKNAPLLVVGVPPVDLQPITVGSSAVSIPVGSLGAAS
jgi:hypothetical protein